MPQPDGELQRRLREYAEPRWGYRRGADGGVEKELFDGVLPAGWFDSPAKVDCGLVRGIDKGSATHWPAVESIKTEPKAPYIVPAKDVDNVESVNLVTPPYDQHRPATLNAEIKRRTGKGMRPGTTRDDMVAVLSRLDAEAAA